MNLTQKASRLPLAVRSGIAATDQAMLSFVSFVVALVLIKYTSKLEYGFYSIGFPITLFLISIQNAIVNTPLAVLLITKKGHQKEQYSASLCYGQFILILPAVCVGLIIIAFLYLGGLGPKKLSLAAALCFAANGILLREFFRALFFAEESPATVLKIDTLYAIIYLGAIILAHLFMGLNAPGIFILMGICALVVGIYLNRKRDWQYRQLAIKESYLENWRYGKWALLGVFVTHIQNYSYLYLLGALLSSHAVADVSAARFLMMPLVLFQAGWIRVIIPHGSRLREEGKILRFFKEQACISLIFVAGVAIYAILLLSFSDVLEKYLLSEKYANSFQYIFLWAVLFSFGFISLSASYGLQVAKRFDIISKVNSITMLLTVGCAYFFIQSHGIKGGLMAVIIGQIVLAIALWFYLTRTVGSMIQNQQTAAAKNTVMADSVKV